MLKDIFGNTILIGSKVAFNPPYYKGLVTGIVVSFHPATVKVEYGKGQSAYVYAKDLVCHYTPHKLWINTSFDGHCPIGNTSAIAFAATKERANILLRDALASAEGLCFLRADAEETYSVDQTNEAAIILSNGDI